MINNSQSFSLENLNTDINFVVGDKVKDDVLNINKKEVIFKNEIITNEVEVYKGNEKVNIDILSSLKESEKITLSSKKFKYIVREYNSNKRRVDYNYISEFNYINNYFYHKYKKSGIFKVKELKGQIDIIVDCSNNCSDYFYVKIIGQDKKGNLKVKDNNISYVYDLDFNKIYEINLISSSNHNKVDKQIIKLTNNANESSKSIKFRTSCKPNKYFTTRVIEELKFNR